jgi:capsid portal protein
MSRRKRTRRTDLAVANETRASVSAFTFGDPEPVNSRATMLDMLECWHNQRWYEPPISLEGLSRSFRASPHHSSAIILKRNMLASSLDPTPQLSRRAFAGMVQDYLVLGNAYVQEVRNRLGQLLRLDHALAKFTRRGLEPGQFWWVPGFRNEVAFEPGTVHQIMAPDINQEIYGLPEYLSALQSALLNENATLFRRRYFENGSHAGYILYATGAFADGDVDAMREALKRSKDRATSATFSSTPPTARKAASGSCRSPRWAPRTSSSASRTPPATTCSPPTASRPSCWASCRPTRAALAT